MLEGTRWAGKEQLSYTFFIVTGRLNLSKKKRRSSRGCASLSFLLPFRRARGIQWGELSNDGAGLQGTPLAAAVCGHGFALAIVSCEDGPDLHLLGQA